MDTKNAKNDIIIIGVECSTSINVQGVMIAKNPLEIKSIRITLTAFTKKDNTNFTAMLI